MKTRFTRVWNSVTLKAIDPFTGFAIERTFTVPHNGGYVREGDKQVCTGLSSMGPTLRADPDTLPAVIRKEWNSYRASAKGQGF